MTASTVGSMAELDTQAAVLLGELELLQGTPVDAQSLPGWLSTYSRIKCEIQTLWAECLLAVKRNANDAEAQALYKHLMSTWIPRLEAYDEPLARMALSAGVTESHPGIAVKLEADLGGQDTEQVAQERLLSGQYDDITSNQKVELSGTDLLPREAQARLNDATEAVERKEIWQAIRRSDLATASELDSLFLQLLRVRQQLARQSGSANYAEHVWRRTNREYTIPDAVELLDSIAEVFADVTTLADQNRAAQLGVSRLSPWDLAVKFKPPGHNTLRVEEYVTTAEQLFEHLDSAFGAVIRKLEVEGKFDLLPRLSKARGNFAVHLLASGTSEVMCNVTGGLEEFRTLLHELGHAVHWHSISSDPDSTFWDFYDFQEVCEFCAFVFTFLGGFRLLEDLKLSEDDQRWFKHSMAESVLARLRDVDERVRFELWLYQQTRDITIEEIDSRYIELYHRSAVDWSGYEDILRKGWQKQHLFLHSFYNIEYSIATVAALLFVRAYKDDPPGAVARLKRAMRRGATLGPTAIFAEAEIQFPFSREQLVIARDVLTEWLA